MEQIWNTKSEVPESRLCWYMAATSLMHLRR